MDNKMNVTQAEHGMYDRDGITGLTIYDQLRAMIQTLDSALHTLAVVLDDISDDDSQYSQTQIDLISDLYAFVEHMVVQLKQWRDHGVAPTYQLVTADTAMWTGLINRIEQIDPAAKSRYMQQFKVDQISHVLEILGAYIDSRSISNRVRYSGDDTDIDPRLLSYLTLSNARRRRERVFEYFVDVEYKRFPAIVRQPEWTPFDDICFCVCAFMSDALGVEVLQPNLANKTTTTVFSIRNHPGKIVLTRGDDGHFASIALLGMYEQGWLLTDRRYRDGLGTDWILAVGEFCDALIRLAL